MHTPIRNEELIDTENDEDHIKILGNEESSAIKTLSQDKDHQEVDIGKYTKKVKPDQVRKEIKALDRRQRAISTKNKMNYK